MFSSSKYQGIIWLRKHTHAVPMCHNPNKVCNSAKWACLMESGSSRKHIMATFCSIRTSCEAKVKASLAQYGAAVSGCLRGGVSEGTESLVMVGGGGGSVFSFPMTVMESSHPWPNLIADLVWPRSILLSGAAPKNGCSVSQSVTILRLIKDSCV